MALSIVELSTPQSAALLLTALVAGLARGFSGFGGALIFVPVASAVVGPRTAAPLLLIIDTVLALGLIPGAWRRADRAGVAIMVLGALVGVPLGTSALAQLDGFTLRWATAALVTLLLAVLISGWRYRGRPAPGLTVCVGVVAGFCSGAAQVGGPPVVAYWLGGEASSDVLRANVVLYFAASSALTGVSYLAGGLVTPAVLALALVAGPAYGLGLAAGSCLFGRAGDAIFRPICFGLIAAAAAISLPVLDGVIR